MLTEEMLMIFPARRLIIWGATARAQWNAPFRLMSEHFVPLLIRHFNQGGARIDSRIVDQNVDAPEFGFRASD